MRSMSSRCSPAGRSAPHSSLTPAACPAPPSLQRLADGIGGWALIASMLGIVIGAVLWAFGRRTTPMKSLVIGLDAPGGGVLAVALLLGVRAVPVGPGCTGSWLATSRRAEVAAEPDRAGSPPQNNSRPGLGTVTCEHSREGAYP